MRLQRDLDRLVSGEDLERIERWKSLQRTRKVVRSISLFKVRSEMEI